MTIKHTHIVVTPPDGYEDATHVILVAPGDHKTDYQVYATVLSVLEDGTTEELEEVGGGGPVTVLSEAGRVIASAINP